MFVGGMPDQSDINTALITAEAPAGSAFRRAHGLQITEAGIIIPAPVTMGDVIGRFDAAVAATGVIYQARSHSSDTSSAHYSPFIYKPGEGKPTFVNTMYVDENNRSVAEIKISKRHEGAHAILWSKLAAAHASPYNMASPIVLCPRDWGRLTRLSERIGMSVTSMLGSADPDATVREAMKKEPGTAEDFELALAQNKGDIEAALNAVARLCLERNSNEYMLPTGKRAEKEPLTLRNYYTWYSLEKFETSNTFRYDYELYDLPAPVFVRLDDQDIHEIGEIMGLYGFGKEFADEFFAKQDPLMWKHQNWQSALNYKLRILNSDCLPTGREALNNYFGVTPDEYLEFSKNYKHGDAPLKQIRPLQTYTIPLSAPLYA